MCERPYKPHLRRLEPVIWGEVAHPLTRLHPSRLPMNAGRGHTCGVKIGGSVFGWSSSRYG